MCCEGVCPCLDARAVIRKFEPLSLPVLAKVANTVVHVLVGCKDLDYLSKNATTVITKTYKLFGEKRDEKRTGVWKGAKCKLPGI